MHCPYCQQAVAEDSGQCVACGLDLGRLDGVLGIPPVISAGLSDLAGVLPARDVRQVKRSLERFGQHFPQIQVALVLAEAPSVVPLRTWAWWLFNRGGFSLALDKGSMNRDILLVLDPLNRQAALTIGYGLEPFVGRRDLAGALEAGQGSLAAGDWVGAGDRVLTTLAGALRVIIGRMSQAYGVPPGQSAEPNESAASAPAW